MKKLILTLLLGCSLFTAYSQEGSLIVPPVDWEIQQNSTTQLSFDTISITSWFQDCTLSADYITFDVASPTSTIRKIVLCNDVKYIMAYDGYGNKEWEFKWWEVFPSQKERGYIMTPIGEVLINSPGHRMEIFIPALNNLYYITDIK